MQSEATPSRASRARMAWSRVTRTRPPLAPIGWPSAIAPPFTLTRFFGMRSSRSTPRDCAANASFSSQRSISSRRRPARSRAFSDAGHGPMPMIDGSTPADAYERIVASGHRTAVALEGRLQRREPLCRRVGPRVLVGVEGDRLALLGGDLDGYDLRLEGARLDGGRGLRLAVRRELVLLLARDPVFARDVLGRDAHVHEGDRAREAVGDHEIEQLVVSHTDPEAGLLQEIRRAA